MIALKILVTGGQGFLGSNLEKFLKTKGHLVFAENFDILDIKVCEKVFSQEKWDFIFHFAGISHIPTSEAEPLKAFEANLLGTSMVIYFIKKFCPKARLIFASSAFVYDTSQLPEKSNHLIGEDFLVLGRNVYGQSKLQAEAIIKQASETWGLRAIVFRIFNHTHKSQSPIFFLPSVYQQILQAKSEGSKILRVGNLDVVRDIGSISDFLKGAYSVCENSDNFDMFEIFNICSGVGKNLRVLLEILCEELGFKGQIETDPTLVRQGEKEFVVGDPRKLTIKTDWLPQTNSEGMLIKSFLNDLIS
jgi:GDP-4-dehydro-6-deoxy-D-mannose reductase